MEENEKAMESEFKDDFQAVKSKVGSLKKYKNYSQKF